MSESTKLSRRALLQGLGVIATGAGAVTVAKLLDERENGLEAEVSVLRASDYTADLEAIVLRGFEQLGVHEAELRGKRVLLKPNLVETALGEPHINTHPAVVLAVARAFRQLGADPFVAEGQGHRRDSWLVLEESGMVDSLEAAELDFVDLNHDDVVQVPNDSGLTNLAELILPKTLVEADWVVSLPKIKTHHWAGVTCAMKNFFGVMPGIAYGWPKNVLHQEGIHQSIVDINAAVAPDFAIADGIIGMEGDGPIMGDPKPLGCLVMGRNLPALDATCARLMGLNPMGATYLPLSSGFLGPIMEGNVTQRGVAIEELARRFAVVDYPHTRALRDT
ncbi:MAG: DUF362 domain-containing protein [Deltaproteobacteria bacterium]|nr:DUF362 domain-containing protein [Deltaproteobacteria bacterium]